MTRILLSLFLLSACGTMPCPTNVDGFQACDQAGLVPEGPQLPDGGVPPVP